MSEFDERISKAYDLIERYGRSESDIHYETGLDADDCFRDLMVYVKGLVARIAELEEERRWMPVSEPPKVSGKYLLLNIYDDVYPCDFIAGTEIWVLPDYDTVTHWMPLPTPPEVQE